MRFLSPCRVTPSRSAARVMLPSHAASAASSSSRSVGGDALGDTDVQLYVPTTGVTTTIAGGPGQQRFADVDDDWIAVTDFSEDPDGRFDANETDLADVVLYERRTGKLSPRKRRLDQVRGIHRTFGLARANQRVHLVDEHDDLALGRLAVSYTHLTLPTSDLV